MLGLGLYSMTWAVWAVLYGLYLEPYSGLDIGIGSGLDRVRVRVRVEVNSRL